MHSDQLLHPVGEAQTCQCRVVKTSALDNCFLQCKIYASGAAVAHGTILRAGLAQKVRFWAAPCHQSRQYVFSDWNTSAILHHHSARTESSPLFSFNVKWVRCCSSELHRNEGSLSANQLRPRGSVPCACKLIFTTCNISSLYVAFEMKSASAPLYLHFCLTNPRF